MRGWCRLRVVENVGKTSPHLETLKFIINFELRGKLRRNRDVKALQKVLINFI